jgi:hypothetical protein
VRAGGRLVAGADPRLALAYPAADLVLLAVYADSVRRRRRGGVLTWKGRAYPARNDPGTVAGEAGHGGRATGRREG